MFIPLPRIILIPYRLIRLVYDIIRKKRISYKDRKILKWLDKSDDPLRQQDYQMKYFNELSTAIENKKSVSLKYSGKGELTYREVLPERLFRRGEHVYLEAFCLKKSEYRRFRLDRIKYLRVVQNSSSTSNRFHYVPCNSFCLLSAPASVLTQVQMVEPQAIHLYETGDRISLTSHYLTTTSGHFFDVVLLLSKVLYFLKHLSSFGSWQVSLIVN